MQLNHSCAITISQVHEATTYDRQMARLETVVLRRAETAMRRALDRWRRVALATKANDVGAHTQQLQTALAQAQVYCYT